MIGQLLGKIPGIPTKATLGRRLIQRGYTRMLATDGGDEPADVLGHVKTANGNWDLVPADHVTSLPNAWKERLHKQYMDGVESWYVPRDGSKPYPADGVGGTPGRLFGTPIAIGYRNFGEARNVTNTELSRRVYYPPEDGYEHALELPEGEETWRDALVEELPESVLDQVGWIVDPDEHAEWCVDWGYRLYRGMYFLKGGASADSLQLMQDPDGRWALERLQFSTEDNLYTSTATGKPADADGIGSEPASMYGTPLGYGFSGLPKLMSAIAPRAGRNLHECELVDNPEKITMDSGKHYTYDGQPVSADGGEVTADVKTAEPGKDDIIIEERAFLKPEDVKLLGGNHEVAEKIDTLVERAKASQHMPGEGKFDKMMDMGKLFMALIFGWWMGKQAGGGGGGGGGISGSIPGLQMAPPDLTVVAGQAIQPMLLALQGVPV